MQPQPAAQAQSLTGHHAGGSNIATTRCCCPEDTPHTAVPPWGSMYNPARGAREKGSRPNEVIVSTVVTRPPAPDRQTIRCRDAKNIGMYIDPNYEPHREECLE